LRQSLSRYMLTETPFLPGPYVVEFFDVLQPQRSIREEGGPDGFAYPVAGCSPSGSFASSQGRRPRLADLQPQFPHRSGAND